MMIHPCCCCVFGNRRSGRGKDDDDDDDDAYTSQIQRTDFVVVLKLKLTTT